MNSFGLIGDPIATSLSPALFNAGYEGKYNYDHIEGADFGASFKAFEDRYKGINVTAPFKEQAFARADIYTSYCRKIGATNLLPNTYGRRRTARRFLQADLQYAAGREARAPCRKF